MLIIKQLWKSWSGNDRAVRENPKGNKEIQGSREMSEVVFMNPPLFPDISAIAQQNFF